MVRKKRSFFSSIHDTIQKKYKSTVGLGVFLMLFSLYMLVELSLEGEGFDSFLSGKALFIYAVTIAGMALIVTARIVRLNAIGDRMIRSILGQDSRIDNDVLSDFIMHAETLGHADALRAWCDERSGNITPNMVVQFITARFLNADVEPVPPAPLRDYLSRYAVRYNSVLKKTFVLMTIISLSLSTGAELTDRIPVLVVNMAVIAQVLSLVLLLLSSWLFRHDALRTLKRGVSDQVICNWQKYADDHDCGPCFKEWIDARNTPPNLKQLILWGNDNIKR